MMNNYEEVEVKIPCEIKKLENIIRTGEFLSTLFEKMFIVKPTIPYRFNKENISVLSNLKMYEKNFVSKIAFDLESSLSYKNDIEFPYRTNINGFDIEITQRIQNNDNSIYKFKIFNKIMDNNILM